MSKKENKVQFNLKNVHYARKTDTGYEKPVKVPGAVSLSLDPQGGVTPFYADGVVYYQSVANNGYSGDLEMARFPDVMLTDIWKYTTTTEEKVIIENALIEPAAFALLFQIDGDADNQCYLLYNCTGTRPGISASTNTDSKTPQPVKSTISAVPQEDGSVMARTTAQTPDAVRAAWFDNVFQSGSTQVSNIRGTDDQEAKS